MGRYEILTADELAQLNVIVDEWVKAGWTPTGGPFRDGNSWHQAVYWEEY